MFNNKRVMNCAVCGKKIKLLAACEISDGLLCAECYVKSKIQMADSKKYCSEDIRRLISQNQIPFEPNIFFPGISFDEKNKSFGIDGLLPRYKEIFRYEDILNYDLLKDNVLITKGSLISTAVGGGLMGMPGAIIGSNFPKKTKEKFKTIKLKITLKSNDTPAIFVVFWDNGMPNSTYHYSRSISTIKSFTLDRATMFEEVQTVMSILDNILHEKSSEITNSNGINSADSASVQEQILRYKEMYDEGVITKEEFSAVKKKILGI